MLLGKSPVNWTWGCGPVDWGRSQTTPRKGLRRGTLRAGADGRVGRWLTRTHAQTQTLRLASVRCLHVTCATSDVWGQKNSLLHASTPTSILNCMHIQVRSNPFQLASQFPVLRSSTIATYSSSNRVTRTPLPPPPLITNPTLSIGGSSIKFSWREAQISRHVFFFSGTPKPTSLPYHPQCAEAH